MEVRGFQAKSGRLCITWSQHTPWVNGPEFLWLPETKWPTVSVSKALNVNDPEVRKKVLASTMKTSSDIIDNLINRHSNIHRLRKVIGWILEYIDRLKARRDTRRSLLEEIQMSKSDLHNPDEWIKCRMPTVSVPLKARTSLSKLRLCDESYRQANTLLIQHVQKMNFQKEIDILREGSSNTRLPKSSPLYKLNPVLIDRVLRVGGRLSQASIPFESKHPIVLPRTSPFSYLILQDIHQSVGHLGRNTMLNTLREHYWILGANAAIKAMLAKCVICKRYQARAFQQKMSDLPKERLTADQPCFTNTGVDFFGPIEVTWGRSQIKRYRVIFTCMASRALHLEVASSLDTDSCINAIRRFISRRGPVRKILSDNGSNLVGSERELREEIEKWNLTKIHDTLQQKGIAWSFNPPAGSHFGETSRHV